MNTYALDFPAATAGKFSEAADYLRGLALKDRNETEI